MIESGNLAYSRFLSKIIGEYQFFVVYYKKTIPD